MIEINLAPESLRKKKRKTGFALARGFQVPREAIIGLVGGLLVLLIITHVVLQLYITSKYFKLKQHQQQWEQISAAKSNVDRLLMEMRRLQGNLTAMDKIRGKEWFSWARKLNELSDNLPRGVWLQKLTFEGQDLLIQGSAVSKNNTEIISIHNFTENLGKDESFMEGFNDLETGLIKSRNVQTTPVADFTVIIQTD